MADKGWTGQAGAAAGIAAGAGAAQLGLGYGLGVIEWPATATASDSTWLNSLGWATWITASATVLGAVIAGRLRADRPAPWRVLWRIALAASSALGALVSVALVALPARAVVRPAGMSSHSPQLVAVGYALIGLVAGVVVAFWAISSTPVAANLLGTAAWLWALAVAGVVAELAANRDLDTYLTSWQFAETQTPVRYGGVYWPSAALTLAAAFLIGLGLAWPTARRGNLGLGTATSGAVGPLLVALSFLALAPLLTEAAGPLQSAYLIAPYAVLAGLAGSALSVSLCRGRAQRARNTPRALPSAAAAPSAASPGTDTAVGRAGGTAKSTSVTPPATEEPARRRFFSGKRQTPKEKQDISGTPESAAPAPRKKAEAAKPAPAPAAAEKARPTSATRPAPAARSATATPPAESAPTNGPTPSSRTASSANAQLPAGEGGTDPEIAAAARTGRAAAKRSAARKEAVPRSTITPPPTNPPIARINPED
ncbi:Hansenula MRAKII killer toxin-resistant protein 1 [Actinoplanes siamensis]|nr:Hansenula MRAKII killer toxin-resistant protein 1 [Actinoplanes siamensis]